MRHECVIIVFTEIRYPDITCMYQIINYYFVDNKPLFILNVIPVIIIIIIMIINIIITIIIIIIYYYYYYISENECV